MKKLLRPYSVIKIPGKSFNDLSLPEVALMIEADSSLSPQGNEAFDSTALDIFIHNANISRGDLKEVREKLLSNIYISAPGEKVKSINKAFLLEYAKFLKDKPV